MPRAPLSVGPPPPPDAAFVAASEVFEAAVAGVPPDAWDDPSPCAGWTVRDVVGHVVESTVKVTALVRDEPFERTEGRPGALAGDDPVAAVRAAVGPARDAIRDADLGRTTDTPRGPATLADALAFPIADLAVHAWDVAHATGRPLRLPDELLAHVVHLCAQVPEELMRRAGGFGPARPVVDDADDTTRLVAWLGRDTG